MVDDVVFVRRERSRAGIERAAFVRDDLAGASSTEELTMPRAIRGDVLARWIVMSTDASAHRVSTREIAVSSGAPRCSAESPFCAFNVEVLSPYLRRRASVK